MVKQRFLTRILFVGVGIFLVMAVGCTRTVCPAYSQQDSQPLVQENEVIERPT